MAKVDWPRDARDQGPFKQNLKCCTYDPFIPNFSLGRLLKTQPQLLAKARGRLTPLGLLPKNQSQSPAGFGQDASKTCAFLEGGRCTIWAERPSVCRSYFCVSDQGASGQSRWREAEQKGNEAEWTLAHEVAWSMGLLPDEVEAGQWAEWAERKEEFYLQCADRAFDPTVSGP